MNQSNTPNSNNPNCSTNASKTGTSGTSTTSTSSNKAKEMPKNCAASVLIESPEPAPDNSYAGILRGDSSNALTGEL